MWMIYGANGYSGNLIAHMAVDQGLKPTLAGRNQSQIEKIATELDLPFKIFSLDDVDEISQNLTEFNLVLHCAGPFSRTAKPMAEACLVSNTHYLDITGEIEVFSTMQTLDEKAKKNNIMLMPGVGFDIVPSDCLALHLKNRLPEATHLSLAFQGSGGISHGTATTMVENLGGGGCIRRDGKLIPVKSAWKTRKINFGYGERKAITIPWGDVFTAYYSTKIPNIEVFMAAPFSMRFAVKASRGLGFILTSAPIQNFMKKQIKKKPAGPNEQERMCGKSLFWGQAKVGNKIVTSTMEGPEGYTFTALAAIEVVKNVLEENFSVGFQTPSMTYGSDLAMKCEGVTRKDII